MSLTITIGGRNYSPSSDYVLQGSGYEVGGFSWSTLRVEDTMAATGDLCTLEGYFGRASNIPVTEEEITIVFASDDVDSYTVFGGVVEEVGIALVSHEFVKVTIHARDYSKWLDRKLVQGVFTDATANGMVTSIVNTFASGFTTTNVVAEPGFADMLPKNFNFIPASEAIQEIADQVNAVWFIDQDRDVHFHAAENESVNIAPLSNYDVDNETEAGNLEFSKNSADIQNALIIKDFHLRGPNIVYEPSADETSGGTGWSVGFVVDNTDEGVAKDRKLNLRYTPYDLDDLTFERNTGSGFTEITAVWDTVSAATPGGGSMSTSRVYVNPGTRSGGGAFIKWAFDLSVGNAVRVSYRPLLGNPWPEVSREPFSISEFARREAQGGRTSDGIYERLVNFRDLEFGGTNPVESLLTFSNYIMRFRAWPRTEGSFECRSTANTEWGVKHAWKAGQTFQLTSEAFDIFDLNTWSKNGGATADPPLDKAEFPVTCWVTSVRITVLNTDELLYRVQFSSNPKMV